MATKKKRTKRMNHVKHATMVARQALKNSAVCYVHGGKTCQLRSLKTGKLEHVSKSVAYMLDTMRFSWSVYLAVFGTDQNGKRYWKSESCIFNGEYKQHELVDYLNDEHKKLIKNFNPQHIDGAGWIACPSGKDLDNKEADFIFTEMGAFK